MGALVTLTQGLLILVLIGLGIAGAVYVNRPSEYVKLGSSVPAPTVQGTTEEAVPSPVEGASLSFHGTPPPEFAHLGQPPQSTQHQVRQQQSNQQQVKIDPITQTVRATIKTNMGDIIVDLYGQDAPITVGNFVMLARGDFYDGTTFHRVIEDFMIQGGDPLSKDPNRRIQHGSGELSYRFPDEINERKLVRGSVAMANKGPNTNGSQFFIVTGESTPHLDGKHTNFGEVVEGMDIVDAISKVEKDAADNPLERIIMEDVIIHD